MAAAISLLLYVLGMIMDHNLCFLIVFTKFGSILFRFPVYHSRTSARVSSVEFLAARGRKVG